MNNQSSETLVSKLQADLQEIVDRKPVPPVYSLTALRADPTMVVSWNESFKSWSVEFNAKLAELELAELELAELEEELRK